MRKFADVLMWEFVNEGIEEGVDVIMNEFENAEIGFQVAGTSKNWEMLNWFKSGLL